MQKKYIKMNNNDEHLSIGNLFRIIKDSSKNKMSALQSEIFCVLFDLEYINDTTVNNYCVGCRSIGAEYKQVFLNKEKKYQKNKNEFANNIVGLLNIVDGVVYSDLKDMISFINSNESAILLARKLYNLAKNDKQIINEFANNLYALINDRKIYECLVEELLFIVLQKKQPVYEDELKKEVFENVLNDTSISSLDLQEYLSLKLREGINFDYSMKKLAMAGNAYANFEIGSNEYYGYFTGSPRYDEAFKYLDKAAEMNHAGANYMIGNMFVRGLIGSKSNEELERGYEYLVKSYNLGNVAASNLIGNMYKDGIYPLDKDLDKAIEYYEKASLSDYAYAYNNLGKIEENAGKIEEAFKYYLQSADLGESWACNKVGEFYRKGIIEHDIKKAYYYYNRALESNYKVLCNYAYYNLAKYFYMDGYLDVVLKSDKVKALEYFEIASHNGVLPATIELFLYNVDEYLKTRKKENMDKILELKSNIEGHPKYNNEVCDIVEKKMEEIKNRRNINLEMLDE